MGFLDEDEIYLKEKITQAIQREYFGLVNLKA